MALRFSVRFEAHDAVAFIVRYQGQPHGYLNQCAHIPSEMDWQAGQFFDLSGLYLICATHGALYLPDSGLCIDGPCSGRSLLKIETLEQDDSIYWRPNALIQPILFPTQA